MGCNCIDEANAKLADSNSEILITIWPVVRPIIATQKLAERKRGKPSLLVASYCPFCGDKYGDKCTCGEVCGEDPNCALHGRHTEWAKENPEMSP